MILEKYKSLGLQSRPTKGDNGVHASASPLEGLAEKANWLGMSIAHDAFGVALIEAGLEKSKIESWFKDPQVLISSTERGSLFDALEDMDADTCLEQLQILDSLN